MLRQLFTVLVFTAVSTSLFAKEGMWIPTLLQKYNIEEMSQMGFKLSAEDVYSVNHASMKDAVVLFGGGCTGGVISNDGLLITNHHCGFGQIKTISPQPILPKMCHTNQRRFSQLILKGLKRVILRWYLDIRVQHNVTSPRKL